MMDHSLHFVIVDDNPDDRTLVARELRREFPAIQFNEIVDASDFEEMLSSRAPDLVITDYQLQWTNGLAVLKNIKQRWPECPVLMFTGTGSEEVAVDAMKCGLDDYVLKSPKHYARLSAAAQLSLRLVRQKRELKEAEARYSTLFETVPVGLFRSNSQGRILDANPAMVAMLCYETVTPLHSVAFENLFKDAEDYWRWRRAMEAEGVVQNFEAQLLCANREVCWVEINARSVWNSVARQTVYEGSLKNISERKAAEDERERLIADLQEALTKIKTLSGLLPICASCKQIRDDNGTWNQIEFYIQRHSDAEFTHSFCPECLKRLYPEVFEGGLC